MTVTLFKNNSQVSFKVYYWKKPTYEEILKKSGFKDIKWIKFKVSKEGIAKYERGYWNDFIEKQPQYHLLECRK